VFSINFIGSPFCPCPPNHVFALKPGNCLGRPNLVDGLPSWVSVCLRVCGTHVFVPDSSQILHRSDCCTRLARD